MQSENAEHIDVKAFVKAWLDDKYLEKIAPTAQLAKFKEEFEALAQRTKQDCGGGKTMRPISKLVQEQKERVTELFDLIKANPDLPIVPIVNGALVCDDGGYWLGGWGSAHIDKYYIHDGEYLEYGGKYPDTTDIFERVFDFDECGIDDDMPGEEADRIMKEKVDSLPWIEAIMVYIDIPESELT